MCVSNSFDPGLVVNRVRRALKILTGGEAPPAFARPVGVPDKLNDYGLEHQISFLFEAVYGWPLASDPDPYNAIIKASPDAQTALRNILNSERCRWFIREDVPLSPVDKWVCTDFQGLRMWINLRDSWLGHVPLFQNLWEEKEYAFVEQHLGQGDAFLDVGVNVGAYTLRAARRVGPHGKVYGFEARPDTAKMVRRSIADNGMSDWVEVENKAVGASSGEAFIHMTETTNHGASYVREAQASGLDVAVEMVTLDEYRFDRRVTVMKMDVEGFEGRVLQGARAFIREHQPVFIGEFCPSMLRANGGTSPVDYIVEWNRLGYEVSVFDDERGVGEVLTPERAAQETSYGSLINVVALPSKV